MSGKELKVEDELDLQMDGANVIPAIGSQTTILKARVRHFGCRHLGFLEP